LRSASGVALDRRQPSKTRDGHQQKEVSLPVFCSALAVSKLFDGHGMSEKGSNE
jgi:hypothetical protein